MKLRNKYRNLPFQLLLHPYLTIFVGQSVGLSVRKGSVLETNSPIKPLKRRRLQNDLIIVFCKMKQKLHDSFMHKFFFWETL
jgi:hypothetical protein